MIPLCQLWTFCINSGGYERGALPTTLKLTEMKCENGKSIAEAAVLPCSRYTQSSPGSL